MEQGTRERGTREQGNTIKTRRPVEPLLWETETPDDEKYCPHCKAYNPQFIFRSTSDRRGQSTLIHARLPVDIETQIEIMIQGGRSPYRTIQEFVRDAIYHRLCYLRQEDQQLDPALQRLKALQGATQEHIRYVDFQQEMTNVRTVVDFLSTRGGAGGRKRALELVLGVYEHVQGFPDPFWRDYWSQELKREFSSYFTGSG